MYLIRFALIYLVFAFAGYFFWKTLLTTSYFQNRRRLRNIVRNTILIALSVFTAGFVISIIVELG